MKYHVLIALFLLVFNVNAQEDYSLFDDSYLHEIRISSEDSEIWNQFSQDYDAFYPDVPYRSVTVEVDGNVLENVGARQKGFSSHFFCPTNKKPLKLNFGKFVDDQEYDGVKKLNLANGVGDPAIIKDKIVYDMYRMHGIPGPRVAHAKIYINDVYWGIYGMIEQIDKRYLKRNFADNDGNLWKNKDNSELIWQGSNPENYTFELQTNETENDWSKFIEFIDFINNTTDADFQSQIEEIFDLDEYLRILAIDILTNNWDSYIEHGRNWYLYHEPKTNKMHWLPWDYNFAFDRVTNGSRDFHVLLNNPQKILIRRILQFPEFRERYLNYMCEILDVNFIETRLIPKLDAQLDLIDDDWDSATNNFFALSDIQAFIDGNLWNGQPFGEPVQGFKKFIEDRIPSVVDDMADENYNCIPLDSPIGFQDVVINEFMANNADESPWNDQDSEHDDWIELYNNTSNSINLSNYFLSDSPSFIHKWEFPDVSIPANGYLIVWADKDPQQEGIHTKFNLDSDGDEIFLSYLDGTIVDSISYDTEQGENQSLSRIPNGTGDFISTEVTFNAENSEILGTDDLTNFGIKIYPNPADTNISINFGNENATRISIYDILGREIYYSTNNSSNVNIDVSNLSTGMYVIKLFSNTFNISKKIVIK